MKKFLIIVLVVCFGVTSLFAQTKRITGTVLSSEDGTPIPGVSVAVKGTTTGTITNAEGNFSLTVPENEILVFSFIGLKAMEVPITGSSVYDVSMEVETFGVEEVVVTALGIQKAKKALGYSVAEVSSDLIQQKPETDIAVSLAGKVAGVSVVKSAGIVGSGSTITIRGNSSINGNNQPLFVIDGIPFDGGSNQIGLFSSGGGNTNMASSRFLDIDPNNIESVNVLKGLSASVLYGEQGRNGVIIISTKTGAGKKEIGMKVSVNQSVYMTSVAKLPDYQNKYGQGGDNVTNVGFAGNWGNPFSDDLTVGHHYDQSRFATVFPEYQGATVPYQAFPNNVSDFFRNGFGSNTFVNFSNGFESGSVNFNLGYTDEEGYIPENDITQINASVGVDMGTDKFKFSGSLNFTKTQYKTPPAAARGAANAVTIFERLLYIPRNFDLTNLPYENPFDHSSVYYRTDQENPYWLVENSALNDNNHRFFGNAKASYDFTNFLNLSYQISLDTYHDNIIYHINKGGVSSVYAESGYLRDMHIRNTTWNHDLLLNLRDIKLTEGLDISGLAGVQVRKDNYTRGGIVSTQQIVYGILQHDNFSSNSSTDELTGAPLDLWTEENQLGVFGQIGLDYKNYAYLTLSGRNDWGSTVEKENRSLFYPSVTLSFLPTSAIESLQSNVLNYLKLRMAYATSAGYPSVYSTRDSYVLNPSAFDGGEGSNPSIESSPFLGNPDLLPELHKEFEVGIETNMFNNRVNLEATGYYRISEDQIVDKRLDPSTGYRVTSVNLGRVDNKGIEIDLGVNPIQKGDFRWKINNVFSMSRSLVQEIGGDRIMTAGFNDQGNFAIEGEPLGVLVGNYAIKDDEDNYLINATDGHVINSNDVGLEIDIVGDPTPDFNWNVINTFAYKGLSLVAQVDYVHGGDFYSQTITTLLRRGVTQHDMERDRMYIVPGVLADPDTGELILDANGNKIPNTIQIPANNLYFLNLQDAFGQGIFDATTLRLREIALSYTLPKNIMNRLPLSSLSFTLSGQNLWYYAPNIPKHTNFDPETLSTGVGNGRGLEYNSAPSSKRFGFTIKATL